MKLIISLVAAGLAFVGTGALAQVANADHSKVEVTPGKIHYVSKQRHEATVTYIDHSTRNFSLRLADGEVIALTAGPQVRNFASVNTGDKVVADYQESIEVTLMKGGTQPVGRVEGTSSTRAGVGGAPTASKMVVLTGNVIKVNHATGDVTLKGATGTLDMTISDPKQLALFKVGDQVRAVTTQTLALSLAKAK